MGLDSVDSGLDERRGRSLHLRGMGGRLGDCGRHSLGGEPRRDYSRKLMNATLGEPDPGRMGTGRESWLMIQPERETCGERRSGAARQRTGPIQCGHLHKARVATDKGYESPSNRHLQGRQGRLGASGKSRSTVGCGSAKGVCMMPSRGRREGGRGHLTAALGLVSSACSLIPI